LLSAGLGHSLKMDESELEVFAKRYEYDRKARGEIIYATVVIESLIERIIAKHFTKDG
jgi:hypothetical protein